MEKTLESLQKHPYYVIPAIEALKEARGEERQQLVRRIALQVGDPNALRTLLGLYPAEFDSFYPDMQLPELNTADTIDSFIDHFGGDRPPKEESLEDLLPPPGAVFSISDLEELPEMEGTDLSSIPTLDLPASTPRKPAAPKPQVPKPAAPKPQEAAQLPEAPATPSAGAESSSHLSESLAKVLIKNGNYQKALEIITEISLNNPKKSVYFAHQIRFLKKLIALSSNG